MRHVAHGQRRGADCRNNDPDSAPQYAASFNAVNAAGACCSSKTRGNARLMQSCSHAAHCCRAPGCVSADALQCNGASLVPCATDGQQQTDMMCGQQTTETCVHACISISRTPCNASGSGTCAHHVDVTSSACGGGRADGARRCGGGVCRHRPAAARHAADSAAAGQQVCLESAS
jgi:hypothetical protein